MDDYIEQLIKQYLKMYSHENEYHVGKGWFPIIKALSEMIQQEIDIQECQQVEVIQVKEKFGMLRFNIKGGNPKIRGMIDMAIIWSSHTCEFCGNYGKANKRYDGLIKTLCDDHVKQFFENMININDLPIHKINGKKYVDLSKLSKLTPNYN